MLVRMKIAVISISPPFLWVTPSKLSFFSIAYSDYLSSGSYFPKDAVSPGYSLLGKLDNVAPQEYFLFSNSSHSQEDNVAKYFREMV